MAPTSKFLQHLQQYAYGSSLHFNLLSFSLCLFFFFLLWLNLFQHKKPRSPPSPPKLPLIGNLHQLGTLPHRSLAALSQKYGPLMLLKLGQIPTLVVSSQEMAREAMKTHDIKFSNRPQSTPAKILLHGCQDVAFCQYGEYWRHTKKICVLELFSSKRVDSFQYVREEEVAELVSRIRKACEDGGSVNLNQLFFSTSNNIVSRSVLGDKFEDENGKGVFEDVARRAMVLVTGFCATDFFPAFGWIDRLRGFIGELKSTSRTMDEFLDKVIEEHREKMEGVGGDRSDKKDFVDIMLQLQKDGMFHYRFTQDSLKAILLDMFIGGSDTTATGLEWTMAELVKNPLVLKKVQEEVRTVVGNKPKIETKDIMEMKYMKCVVKESLRLHPPIPLLIPRETTETVDIEGYHIPSKVSVLINVWAIQRDPRIWNRPDEFVPERFMNSRVDFQGQDYELIPFGSGRRRCPGISFGVTSFEYIMASLLYWFDWEIPEGAIIDMSEEHGLTVRKKTPLHLKPVLYV